MPAPAIVAMLMMLTADDRAAPVCEVASHDRLIIRVERDVCAPTLNRSGRPIAMGFLPTRCRDATRTYHIDAAGSADRCVVAVTTK
ncbi:MAG: hypothetical protein ABI240_16730 [Sphingomonas sp.]